MRKPKAILISDIHFNINTLEVASSALKAAISKAWELRVPLIIAGDLHDTKAMIRAEVANRLLSIIQDAVCEIHILVGNHDLINEKGQANALEFLNPYVTLVDHAYLDRGLDLGLVPYLSGTDCHYLNQFKVSTLIMHQGFLGAHMGDYIQDKSSISPDVVKDYRVFSGHYHRHQTIGTVTYIGSPYTITFGEANDGPKGFLVLYDDNSFEQVVLNLRKHVILDISVDDIGSLPAQRQEDLVWLKIRGPKSKLDAITKNNLSSLLNISNFKLDLIPDSDTVTTVVTHQTDEQLLDGIIENSTETNERKKYLKTMWRDLLCVYSDVQP